MSLRGVGTTGARGHRPLNVLTGGLASVILNLDT